FIALVRGVLPLRQEILKLCGVSAVWTRVAFVDNLNYPKLCQGEIDVVCRLMAQAWKCFRRISAGQKIYPIRRSARQVPVKGGYSAPTLRHVRHIGYHRQLGT